MRYMLLLAHDGEAAATLPADVLQDGMAQMFAYKQALEKANAFIDTGGLGLAADACTVQVRDGRTKVQDGPYAETREQLGGYFIIRAADMEAACKWAARCPGATWGTVEVRPIMDADAKAL